jgi:putative ABC transport system permease protein
MPEYVRTPARGFAERVHRALMRVYPRDFREEFGDAMAEFFHDRLTRARPQGRLATAAVCWRAFRDLIRNALPARVDSLRRALRVAQWRAGASDRSYTIRHARRRDWMLTSILQDLRHAVRAMLARPSFTAVVLLTLALGVGANVAIFSVVNGVLLRPLPHTDPDRLVTIAHAPPSTLISEPEFADYKRDATSFERVAAIWIGSASITGDGQDAEQVPMSRVTDGFFALLGTTPLLGRTPTADEDRPRVPSVLVLSYGFWQRRFGADSAIIGKEIEINGVRRPVIGVMPKSFAYPGPEIGIWSPLRLDFDSLWTRNNHYLRMIGRLAPGVSIEQARTQMRMLTERMTRDFPEVYTKDQPLRAVLTQLDDALLGQTRPYLYALLGAVAFVLLIACVNVANMLLARGESRRKDIALRTALGASRLRLVRQALTESTLLAVTGGALGVVLAWWGVRVLLRLAPPSIPRLDEVRVDAPVLIFALLITVVTGLLFGLVPAARASRGDAAESLKEGGKTSGQARGLLRARTVLVVGEIALAVVTLGGAGLMIRSLTKLQEIDLGFRPDHVLSMTVVLPQMRAGAPPTSPGYDGERAAGFYRAALDRVRAMNGVVAAGAVGDLPVADDNSMWSILVDGAPMTTVSQAPSAMPQQVTPGYFEAMRIPLVSGRLFTVADATGAAPVVIINETMARAHWRGKDPLGHTVKMLNETSPWVTIVGVVKDVRSKGHLNEVPPTMYFPHEQAGKSAYYTPTTMNLVVRSASDPALLIPALRRVVREMEPSAPLPRVRTMDDVVAASIASRRFSTQLLAGFAAVALVLAGLGIYGVVSYGVSRRTFEMGLRMALGAQRGQVMRLVMREAGWMALLGFGLGLAGAYGAAKLIRSMLVGVGGTDPVTLAAVMALLGVVALVASAIPARMATQVDPIDSLRRET